MRLCIASLALACAFLATHAKAANLEKYSFWCSIEYGENADNVARSTTFHAYVVATFDKDLASTSRAYRREVNFFETYMHNRFDDYLKERYGDMQVDGLCLKTRYKGSRRDSRIRGFNDRRNAEDRFVPLLLWWIAPAYERFDTLIEIVDVETDYRLQVRPRP